MYEGSKEMFIYFRRYVVYHDVYKIISDKIIIYWKFIHNTVSNYG